MRILATILAGALSLCAGCAANAPSTPSAPPAPKAMYSAAEKTKLTPCVGMTDIAWSVAERKLRGEKIDQVKALYAPRPNSKLTLALVDKVYGESFRYSWDYAVSFFNECALEMASVPSDRARLAAYCMQNGMIASVAQTYRASGLPKEKAYERFAQFQGDTPRKIIDGVYAQSKSRAESEMETWQSCMAPISG
jgi:hypothetical protein